MPQSWPPPSSSDLGEAEGLGDALGDGLGDAACAGRAGLAAGLLAACFDRDDELVLEAPLEEG
jgi:hypothetical protein